MYPRILFILLLPLFAIAQSPQKINFQSVIRNNLGEVQANKSVKLKISIQRGSMMDTTVYSETHLKTTDVSGLMSIKIGNGTVLSGVFSSIDWGNTPHFIKLEVDFSGGNNFVLLGIQELMSVPYALYASKTDTSSLNLTNRFSSKVNISDTATMLLNYRNALNNKLNITDTMSMLANYWRKNEQNTILQSLISNLQNNLILTDVDGNNYNIIQIGNQIWMKENLKVSKYRNGDSIQTNLNNADWTSNNNGAFDIYENNPNNNIGYGKLYNFFAISNPKGLCPFGWKVPTLDEMNILFNYLGGTTYAAEKLKQAFGWLGTNRGNNISDFSANAGGRRWDYGDNEQLISQGNFWMSTEIDADRAKSFIMNYGSYSVLIVNEDKNNGFSVRCLKE
jgi:uncharacterized protein (TIGR02145 family)